MSRKLCRLVGIAANVLVSVPKDAVKIRILPAFTVCDTLAGVQGLPAPLRLCPVPVPVGARAEALYVQCSRVRSRYPARPRVWLTLAVSSCLPVVPAVASCVCSEECSELQRERGEFEGEVKDLSRCRLMERVGALAMERRVDRLADGTCCS